MLSRRQKAHIALAFATGFFGFLLAQEIGWTPVVASCAILYLITCRAG